MGLFFLSSLCQLPEKPNERLQPRRQAVRYQPFSKVPQKNLELVKICLQREFYNKDSRFLHQSTNLPELWTKILPLKFSNLWTNTLQKPRRKRNSVFWKLLRLKLMVKRLHQHKSHVLLNMALSTLPLWLNKRKLFLF